MKKATTTLLFLSFFVFAFAQNDFANLSWKYVPDFDYMGDSNMISYDVDGDGTPEVIYGGTYNQRSVIKVLDYQNETYEASTISSIYDWRVEWMEVFNINAFGGEKLFVLTDEDEILVMDLNSLTIEEAIPVPSSGRKFHISDTNGDNAPEIIVLTNSKVSLLDASGGLLYEKSVSSGNDLAIGNVDDDPAVEIIVSATDGYVLSGTDLSEEWAFLGGFGDQIYLQDIDSDGIQLIYGAENYSFVKGFDAVLSSPIWEFETSSSIDLLKVEDPDGDGNFEIFIGNDSQFEGIQSYDAVSHILLYNKPIENSGLAGLTFGDFDNDGQIEHIYSCGHITSSEDLLVVYDPFLLTNKWVSLDLSEGMLVNTGNFDGDDEGTDLIVGSVSSNSGYDGGVVAVYDGLTKTILKEPEEVNSFNEVEAYSMIRYDETTYLLYLVDSRVYIFNETTGNMVIDVSFFSEYIKTGEFAYLNPNEPPVLITLHTNGSLKIHEFHQNILTEIWSAPTSSVSSAFEYQIGDFDFDTENEIAFLSGSIVSVYGLDDFLLEKQFSLGSGNFYTFHIDDLEASGSNKVYFSSSAGQLKSLDYETSNPLSTYTLLGNNNNGSVRKIKFDNLDQTPQKEVVILTDRILVYNNAVDSLILAGEIVHSSSFSFSKRENLIVEDIDQDRHMEIIAGGLYGVFEYKVVPEFLDIVLPTVKNFTPLEDAQLISTNSTIAIKFSEAMDDATLSTIEVKDASNNLLPYTSTYDEGNNELTLTPSTFWTSNSEISVTIFHTSSDEIGNPLDGNFNAIGDGTMDNFTWSFDTGTGIDDIGPTINGLSAQTEIFQGAPFSISGTASDQSLIAVTHIAYIEYGLDSAPGQGVGISLEALDETFDEVDEDFELTINTTSLSYGDHTLYFRARDVLGNWGEVSSYTFNIIEESAGNWNFFASDLFNTSANSQSTFTFPATVKYEKDHSTGGFSQITRAIVVEDYLVYGSNSFSGFDSEQLRCIDLHSGDEIWEYTFDLQDDLSSPAYSYGNIYVQKGSHSSSSLACYDLVTGDLIWETPYSVQWTDLTGPIVNSGIVYIIEGYYSSTIGAYDAFSGEQLWTYDVGNDNYDGWNPAIYQDTIYGYAETFSALNLSNGGLFYELTEDDIPFNWSGWSMDASPVIDTANHQIILTSAGYVHALDLDTKEINWSLLSNDYGSFRSSPCLFNGQLYIASNDQYLRADAATGIVSWENDDFNGFSQPVANTQIVAFGGYNEVTIFDIETMELQSQLSNINGQLTLSEEYLIISSRDLGTLTVLEYNPNQEILVANIEVTSSISCSGGNDGTIEVTASGGTGGYSYQWSVFQSNPGNVLSNVSAGDYAVTILDDSGSSIISTISVGEPSAIGAVATTTPDIGMAGDGSATIDVTGGTPDYDFEWADFPGVNTNTLSNLEAGNYVVVITDANGCSSTTTAVVEAMVNTNEPDLSSNFTLSPNPTTGIVNIQGMDASVTGSVSVVTANGKVIKYVEKQQLDNFSISLEGYPTGLYLIKLTTAEGNAMFKISLIQ